MLHVGQEGIRTTRPLGQLGQLTTRPLEPLGQDNSASETTRPLGQLGQLNRSAFSCVIFLSFFSLFFFLSSFLSISEDKQFNLIEIHKKPG